MCAIATSPLDCSGNSGRVRDGAEKMCTETETQRTCNNQPARHAMIIFGTVCGWKYVGDVRQRGEEKKRRDKVYTSICSSLAKNKIIIIKVSYDIFTRAPVSCE